MELILIIYSITMTALFTLLALCASLVIWSYIKKEGK
jgi:hypothetical protein